MSEELPSPDASATRESAETQDADRVGGAPHSLPPIVVPTPGSAEAPVSGILFDQYSRYGACARSIRSLLPEGGTVLDVGSGRPRLLGGFLPGYQVTYLDPGLQSDASDAIASDLFEADLAAGSFDVVTNIDTLEHIPSEDRCRFLERLIEVARRGVVLAAPFSEDGLAAATDRRVNEIYQAKTGQPYPWLEEHEAYGLPSLAETEQQFRAAGLDTASIGNGRTQWLEELLGMHVLLLDGGQHTEFLASVGDYFAEHMEPFDHLPPVYRQVIVAWTGQAPSLMFPEVNETMFGQAAAAWETFRDWFQVQLAEHLERMEQTIALTQKTLSAARQDHSALQKRCLVAQQESAVAQQECAVAQQECAAAQQELDGVRREWQEFRARVESGTIRRALGAARWMAHRVGLRGELEWRIKSAFFWVLWPFVRNTREYHEFLEARSWRNRRPVVTEAETPSVFVTPADRCLDDVIVFGVINWGFRIQRPQHLTLELARRGHRVFYISPGFIDLATPGFQLGVVDSPDSVYEVRFHATGRPMIYEGVPSGEAATMLVEGLRQFLAHVRLASCRVLVDHPSWHVLAGLVPRASIFYDCMDNHSGFAESGEDLRADEDKLLAGAAGVVVSSDGLSREIRKSYSGPVALVRNGCDPDHFASIEVSESTTYCIGYFGAIAEWFDKDLVMQLAKALPECQFLLVGNDTAEVTQWLRSAKNVQLVGEIPYHELPHWISRMDVCLIPFLINELTLATNPVKVYEALAAGRPVVATPMPELMTADFNGLVHVAERGEDFVQAVRAALSDCRDSGAMSMRRTFARAQSWRNRCNAVARFMEELPAPSGSVIVITWNGVELSRRCVRSVLDDPAAPEVEVIVVDNASGSETQAWLDELEATEPRVRVIRNTENRGFGPACNQGLAIARGDWLVILNNDIVVTRGWLRTMIAHAQRDPSVGLIGPVTNNIGNEARVSTSYQDLEEMEDEQAALTGKRAGEVFDIPVLAFFSVMIPRSVYAEIGGLDEGFEVGFFEDDDYCMRVREIGRRVVCAEDVFVHHELSASFKKLKRKDRDIIFERNKEYYESKWGAWVPHGYRDAAGKDLS